MGEGTIMGTETSATTWDDAMVLRDTAAKQFPAWSSFQIALRREVCMRTGRPWVSESDIWRWVIPEDIMRASSSASEK
jgi:hypothetical protein